MRIFSEIMWYYHILIALVIVWLYQHFLLNDKTDESTLLKTSLGVLKGAKSEDGYTMYLGVPYAVVDKNNPFGESLPHPGFDYVFDASAESADLCPQIQEKDGHFAGSLDCLWLNIYVPKSASSSNLLPVFVWFPGGKFMFGSPKKYIYGPKFLLRHDIIVVTVSSRLGPYGFLCLGTPEIPGNQGLKDQVAALKWIKNYINEFNGDPDKVTIAGSSSSAFGVDLILRSDVEDLFDKIIIQSGTVEFKGVLIEENHDVLFNISSELGFITNNVTDALKILAKIDPKIVVDAAAPLSIGPCIEKEFDNVDNLITKESINKIRKAKDVSVLIGNVDNELLCERMRGAEIDLNEAKESIRDKILPKNKVVQEEEENEIINDILHFYLDSDKINDTFGYNFMNFNEDVIFYHPTQRFLNNYLKNGGKRAYHYIFSFVGGRNFMRNRLAIRGITIHGDGATHADELGYLFDISYEKNLSVEDQLIIDRITRFWANFVKYGDPTPITTELLPVKWLPVTETKSYYLNITIDMELKTHVHHRRMTFWDLFYKKYGSKVAGA